MKALEFAKAATLARSDVDLSTVDTSPVFGCGLPGFAPVFVTLPQVAAFIRWQTSCFDGSIDSEAMAECAAIARKKFFLIGADCPPPVSQPVNRNE